ncbi:YitT family protein [Cellulophaga sp. HaHa_2_95]|uniref:YitT family protein n=1 Tax=Cellulophaga TaxID=104264 RepID=UPI00042520FF|nr:MULTISPECIES: YitT family protein [Cellulophaga]QXP50703.1 YitT family protein [Cellulophaga sp. HaHa_2_1]QXP56976.1 YitT family protein [Cellulophaga sp. HaHa_2_95]
MPNSKTKGYRLLGHAGAYLKRSRKLRVGFKGFLKDMLFILVGIFSAAFGLESFLLPNKFIDGGATGISLLATEIFALPLPILILVVNVPFLIMGYKVIGKTFAVKATIAILGLALVLSTVHFPEITQDKLLVAVFGGFFLGAGIGLSIRGGGVLDGTEVLAIFLSRKLGTTIGDIIILINIVIFLAAAYFLSIETALYSMLTYLSASKTLDFVVDGIEEYTGVTIISGKSEEIRVMISEKLGRGLTVYRAKGGFSKDGGAQKDYDVIYTVITRLEIRRLNIEISKIDATAFVVMNSINDTRGGMIKKRHL